MSALSFKINADTAKLNNFIKSLKLLYQLLEKFPSNSDGFKVINRHIADMEARVEQAMPHRPRPELLAAVLRQEQRLPRPKLRHIMTCLVS